MPAMPSMAMSVAEAMAPDAVVVMWCIMESWFMVAVMSMLISISIVSIAAVFPVVFVFRLFQLPASVSACLGVSNPFMF